MAMCGLRVFDDGNVVIGGSRGTAKRTRIGALLAGLSGHSVAVSGKGGVLSRQLPASPRFTLPPQCLCGTRRTPHGPICLFHSRSPLTHSSSPLPSSWRQSHLSLPLRLSPSLYRRLALNSAVAAARVLQRLFYSSSSFPLVLKSNSYPVS